MDFKEFTTRAEQDIRAALEDASPGVGVGMNQVEKLQGESYTAITLTPEGTNIGMNLNLNQLYDRMQRGEDYDSILQAAVDQAKEHLSNMPRFDVAELSSYETAKDLLFVDVVGTKVNAEMLAKVPHTDMEDISMVYRMQLEQLSDGAATVLITNDLMNRMGVTKEQLHADAMANSEVVRPASMRTMAEVMAQMMGMSVEDFPRQINPKLRIEGILLTMVDARTNYSKEIAALIRDTYGGKIKVYDQMIPRSIRAAEISAEGKSIFSHDPDGKVAQGYKALTQEVMHDAEKRRKRELDQLR